MAVYGWLSPAMQRALLALREGSQTVRSAGLSSVTMWALERRGLVTAGIRWCTAGQGPAWVFELTEHHGRETAAGLARFVADVAAGRRDPATGELVNHDNNK